MRQMVINLVRNAFEAMDQSGCVVVKTMYAKAVSLSVQDCGKGIPPEVMAKLGTPFFSTKDNGTGLGLAVSYRIADRHQASLHFQSSTDGTTVTVSFGAEQPTMN
ncbi:MAG: ATP-binding protein [Negativicutes bacterium]|nr:ATP-binding protein [Negativicutes bacterium]